MPCDDDVGWTRRLPVTSSPMPPFARSVKYATSRAESAPLTLNSRTCAVCMIRLRISTFPMRSGLKRCG